MGYIVRMPQMGMSMEEGTVVEWAVLEGEATETGNVVAVVESEKAANEIEAREDGVLRRIIVSEGGTVEPGDPIGIVAGRDESLSEYVHEIDDVEIETSSDQAASMQSPQQGGTPVRSNGSTSEEVRATPGARQVASNEDVTLANVEGTGPQGVITEDDVEAHVDDRERSSPTPGVESDPDDTGGPSEQASVRATPGARRVADERGVELSGVEGTGPQGVVTEEDVENATGSAIGSQAVARRTVTERRELSGMQSTVAERLGQSYREAVHVTLNRNIDATALTSLGDVAGAASTEVSLSDLLIAAVGRTLPDYPELNAVFEDGEHRLIEEVNVGVAVDVNDGLLTPVIPSVESASVEVIATRRRELTERVRSGAFTTDDLSGGTFTVSNLGMFGVDHFDPIIDPPQVAILGVGRVRDDGTMTLSLTFDHRVINGADAARFLDGLTDRLTDEAGLAEWFDADVRPEDGTATREVTVSTPEMYRGEYRTQFGTVPFDEPGAVGGGGTAPTPVNHLLGALGSCLALSTRQMAARDDVEVGAIECDVSGSPPGGPLERIRLTLRIDSDASNADIERVVTKAERSCYVARTLSPDLDVALRWERL
jgi:pyruvate dehydrogenase E2 component (dihydrolipoamide acetyltransferase)